MQRFKDTITAYYLYGFFLGHNSQPMVNWFHAEETIIIYSSYWFYAFDISELLHDHRQILGLGYSTLNQAPF